jgi:hypothetical protein
MFKIGDKVIVDPQFDLGGRFAGVVFEVERFKQVNVLLRPISGSPDGRKLNCRPSLLLAATDDVPQSTTVIGRPYVPHLYPGEVVTVESTHRKWTYADDQRFVVLNQTTPDRVKVAKLGGEEGRTWTLPRSNVTVVEL